LPLDSPFPPVWLAGHDATNEAAGVRCELVVPPWKHVGRRALKLLGIE
jgi:hypothetical protein